MAMVMSGSAPDVHNGFCAKTRVGLERRIAAAYGNWKRQREAWRQFHRSAAGRHVPRRAWMRHGALLEAISQRRG